MERTFFMIKPDGVKRDLVGEIIRRLNEIPNVRIVKFERHTFSREEAEEHYKEHRGRPFFADLVEFTISGPVVRMVIEGSDVVSKVRAKMGATNLADALSGTIRGDLAHFGATPQDTVVHGSDSPESAEREIALHFGSKSVRNN